MKREPSAPVVVASPPTGSSSRAGQMPPRMQTFRKQGSWASSGRWSILPPEPDELSSDEEPEKTRLSMRQSIQSLLLREKLRELGGGDPSENLGGEAQSEEQREKLRKKHRRGCAQFVLTVFLLINFLAFIFVHEDIAHVYELEHALEVSLTKTKFGAHSKTFHDVQTVDGFWKWLENGLLDTLVKQVDLAGNPLPHDEWSYIMNYNRIIGGVRLVQERGKTDLCSYRHMDSFYPECQPYDSHSKAAFGYPACGSNESTAHAAELLDDYDIQANVTACFDSDKFAGMVDFRNDEGFTPNGKGSYEMWLDLEDDEVVIRSRVLYLETRHWVDRQTKHVRAEMLVYNGQTEPLIMDAILDFYFTRHGYIEPTVSLETVPLDAYHSDLGLKILLEVLFALSIVHCVIEEIAKISRKRRAMEAKQGVPPSVLQVLRAHLVTGNSTVPNWLDLAAIGMGVTICAEWVLFLFHLRDARRAMLHLERPGSIVSYDDTDGDEWSHYHHEVAHVEHLMRKAIYDMVTFRRLAGLFIFLILFRLFAVWENIPVLQGVSRTVRLAAARLASFSVIMICLITLFAGSAMSAFGQQMEEFHNMQTALVSTLVVMTTGDSDTYEKQYLIDPLFANIWHWLLITVMWVVCLNLVLCILVDAYTEAMSASKDIGDAPSLTDQLRDLVCYYARLLLTKSPASWLQPRYMASSAKCGPATPAAHESPMDLEEQRTHHSGSSSAPKTLEQWQQAGQTTSLNPKPKPGQSPVVLVDVEGPPDPIEAVAGGGPSGV